jgi:hypothetical protein
VLIRPGNAILVLDPEDYVDSATRYREICLLQRGRY